ncbi:MAG: Uma2 family endonuclease [Bacteroidota bacterium]
MPSSPTIPPPGFLEWWEENVTVLPNQTIEDWRALPEGTRAELINGTIVMSPAPRVLHQVVVARFYDLLSEHVRAHDLGLVLLSPLDVKLTDTRAFQPDVVFIAADRLGILGEQEVEGAPDLVAEVLSPSTGYYDATAKRLAYAEAGVRELWLLDPGEHTVDLLVLDDDDFRLAGRVVGRGAVESVLMPGLAVEADGLFTWPGA